MVAVQHYSHCWLKNLFLNQKLTNSRPVPQAARSTCVRFFAKRFRNQFPCSEKTGWNCWGPKQCKGSAKIGLPATRSNYLRIQRRLQILSLFADQLKTSFCNGHHTLRSGFAQIIGLAMTPMFRKLVSFYQVFKEHCLHNSNSGD